VTIAGGMFGKGADTPFLFGAARFVDGIAKCDLVDCYGPGQRHRADDQSCADIPLYSDRDSQYECAGSEVYLASFRLRANQLDQVLG
jgi:hypothetical protein